MNRIIIISIGAVSLLSGSCKKMLKETPYSLVSTGNFYKTASDAELAITGVYDVLDAPNVQNLGNQALWGRGMHYMTNLGADDLTEDTRFVTQVPELVPFYNYSYTADNTLIWYSYFSLYAGINRANFIIEKVPSINMNVTRRDQIVAEARYMRGMFYCYLAWLWGGVPLITGTVPDLTSPRASIQQVLQQAEEDLKAGYEGLPARNTKTARANKYTAAGFLAKLYLYEASCKQNNVGQTLNFPLNSFDWVNVNDAYAQSLKYAKDVYDNSGYKLIRPYNYLFLAATEVQARDENMMIVQAGAGGNQEYILWPYLAGPTGSNRLYSAALGFLRPVRELYQTFDHSDGRFGCLSGAIPNTPATVIINNFKYYTPEAILGNLSNLNINKWREDDPNNKTTRAVAIWGGETDFAILRFADIVLMYAEASFQTGDEAGARSLLRELRLRACGDDAAKTDEVTTAYFNADFMTELLGERLRELFSEGWRRIDLVRLGRLKSVVSSLNSTQMFIGEDIPTVISNYQDYKIWYPIPSRDISTNPNLVQNTGY